MHSDFNHYLELVGSSEKACGVKTEPDGHYAKYKRGNYVCFFINKCVHSKLTAYQ